MPGPRISAHRLVAMAGPPDARTPSYAWLADAVRLLVADGRLLHGTRLPSERELVTATGLSRTTVSRAYAELRERGYARARHGSGTLVQIPGGPVSGAAEPLPLHDLGEHASGVIDLRSAAPSGQPGLAAAFERAVERLGAYTGGMGYFPLGVPELREAVAQRYRERGVPTRSDQIVVTTGALAGCVAAFRAVLHRGDRVLLQSPSYPGTLASLRQDAVRLLAVPAESGRTDLEAIAERAAASSPRAMLALPDFHNPTGTLMDDDERARLAGIWERHGVVGVVDETLCELWLQDEPSVRPMAAHAPGSITVGGVSKSHWGGLRIGWVRAPRDLVGAVARARTTFDLAPPVLEQLVVTDLLQTRAGLPDDTRRGLRERRDLVHGAISRELPGWQALSPSGGLSLWWRLPVARSSALSAAAERRGVLLAPGSAFAVEGQGLERWVRTPYALPAEQLEVAVERIVAAWREVVAHDGTR
ncbi:PLP-dependent aminotransferase family protein [Luteipulveratus sp. YIM 133132]|uniref:MocR-like transcription factor YczR n=1 Tax=Luteipulveratus flavus TaxID=3031728 RepID=UPI0023AFD90E|nr:PLP-dependent aminotransferase family protein [Luteipulveratus sp. YIM 133132]MDE9366828.1 PLP-dependent aminotransferase family protein [Luteipulveratus sp. YIM 133132]